MRNSRLICMGIILLTAPTACNKHNSQRGPNTIVYVAGCVAGTNGLQPVYWKNGVSNSLPAMLSGVANAITIVDTNVYIGGTCFTDTGAPVITYWKNGVLNVLRNYNFPGGGASIAVSGSDVYLTGNGYIGTGYSSPSYWKNGTIDTLPAVGNHVETIAITVSAGDVYVAGYDDTLFTSEVWKNGVATSIGPGAATSIAVTGQDVYIAGDATVVGVGYIPTVWKNGVATTLGYTNANYIAGGARAITISGNDVYVAGYSTDKNGSGASIATYWKNGSPVTLDPGVATAICISGSDVYVAGNKFTNPAATTSVYWKNGVATALPGSVGTASAIAVQVVN